MKKFINRQPKNSKVCFQVAVYNLLIEKNTVSPSIDELLQLKTETSIVDGTKISDRVNTYKALNLSYQSQVFKTSIASLKKLPLNKPHILHLVLPFKTGFGRHSVMIKRISKFKFRIYNLSQNEGTININFFELEYFFKKGLQDKFEYNYWLLDSFE